MFVPPPRKRARTGVEEDVKPEQSTADSRANPSDPGEADQLEKDEEFWFEDGTVILHAGDVEFRVYRRLLEGHSTVFAEMFARPHCRRAVAIDGQQNVSCPVVKLSDSAHDVRRVLCCCIPRHSGRHVGHKRGSAFVDIINSPFINVTPSFDLVSAAIRLGHKYKINDMYQKGLSLLKGHYTDKFSTWSSSSLWSPSGWHNAQAIGVINLARLTGELSLLPVAFMVCVVRLDADLVRGFTHEDGSQEHLTLDDIGLCFQARNRLREASVAALFRVLATPAGPTCEIPHQCKKMLQNVFRGKSLEANVGQLVTGDVLLSTADNYFKTEDHGFTLCQACSDAVNA